MDVIWLIVTSSSVPTLTGSRKSERISRWTPSTQSSTYMNERVCRPSPQISIVSTGLARAILRDSAAGAFSLPPS